MIHISIVVPMFNAEKRIEETLRKILGYADLKGVDAELIVVDDGSTDNVAETVKRVSDKRIDFIRIPSNKGKGFAVRTGVLRARKEWVLFTDADLSTPIEDVERLFAADVDVAIGSRDLPGSNVVVHQHWYRELSGKVFNRIVRMLCVNGIADTQCGFKLFRQQAAKDIFESVTIDGFGFDVEALFIARRHGFTIKEVPVTWINDPHSTVRLVPDAIRMFIDLIRIRWNAVRGKYGTHQKGPAQ